MATQHPSIPEAFRAIAICLDSQRIPYVVIGGLGASLQGEPRLTIDVDLMVTIPSTRIREFAQAAREAGFTIDPELVRTQWLASGFARIWYGLEDEGVRIDLMACNSKYLEEVAWRSQATRFAGLQTRVATPEDMVLLKCAAWRERDLVDVRMILERHASKVDAAYLRRWASWLAKENDYFDEMPRRIDALLAGGPVPPPRPD